MRAFASLLMVIGLVAGCGAHGLVPAPPKAGPAAEPKAKSPTLHPTITALLYEQGHDGAGDRRGVYELPSEACQQAVRWAPDAPLTCTAILLGRGAALLVLQEANCEAALCVERSWVFMRPYRAGLPLPTRRKADYQALRAELTNEQATALWLAGFRGSSEARTAALEDDGPSLASYASCSVTPEGGELVCRTVDGGAVGLDPVTGRLRVVARVDVPGVREGSTLAPVRFTGDGQLALTLSLENHALCDGTACEVTGFVAWPSVSPQLAHLVREDSLPY